MFKMYQLSNCWYVYYWIMAEKLLVPDIGDFDNVEIIEVLVKTGDNIKKNDPIVTLESDKSSVEVPSTYDGKVENVNVKIGDKVSKGDLLITLKSSKEKEKKKYWNKKRKYYYWKNTPRHWKNYKGSWRYFNS